MHILLDMNAKTLELETMEFAQAEIDLEYPEENFALPKENCGHCGGIMRYYMGTVSCLLCGRDHTHYCQNCVTPKVPAHAASAERSGSAQYQSEKESSRPKQDSEAA